MAELDLTNIANASISTPPAGVTAAFVDTDKKLKVKDDTGTVSTMYNMTAQTIATAAGTTTLLNTSPVFTVFTGATTQTVKLPDATTIQAGQVYRISNTSSGLVTVQDGNAGALIVLSQNGSILCTLVTAGTIAGVWSVRPIGFFTDGTDATKKLVFTESGASTGTILTLADTQTTSQTLNIPNITATDTLDTLGLAQNITGVKTMTNMTTLAGTTSVPSMTLTGGTNLTSVTAGAVENDSIGVYMSTNTTDGRAHVPARQHFRLTANGSNVTTIGNFFGTTSNISLVASAYYMIEIVMYFTKTTAEAVTWTLTNSSAPTSQNIYYEQSPITGIVAPPGTATNLFGQIVNDATAAKTIATGVLVTGVNHYVYMRIELKNGTGTSLKIQATNPTGSITPLLGSYWTATRIPTGNTGTFAA